MKKFTYIALMLSSFAMASEPVLIKELRQKANLMPPVESDRPIYTTLEVDVLSTGCTSEKDFQVRVVRTSKEQTLEIFRTRPDLCEVVAHRKTITLETRKLGLTSETPTRIINPVYGDEAVVH